MSNLLRANLSRLLKSRLFRIIAVLLTALCAYNSITSAHYAGSDLKFERFFFDFIPNTLLAAAVFSPLFIGTEYGDGVIRGKIIAGYRRETIFLSNLSANVAACLILFVFGALGSLAGMPISGAWKCGADVLALYFAVGILLTIAAASLYTMCETLITAKAASAVTVLLLVFVVTIASAVLYDMLGEQELVNSVSITANGVEIGPPEPNPYYVAGIKRAVYELLIDLNPFGQGIQLSDFGAERPIRMMLCSVGVTVTSAVIGAAAFAGKDLK